MILIFSNSYDFTTQEVCKWLKYYDKEYILINEFNTIDSVEVKFLDEYSILLRTSKNEEFKLNTITNSWYRRGKFTFKDELVLNKSNYFDSRINDEIKIVSDYIMYKLANKDFFKKNVNKIIVNDIANSLGFKIPTSLISYKKEEVVNIFSEKRIITKPISEIINFQDNNFTYSSKTREIKLTELDDNFNLSFFQELIEKKYEIRVFIYNNKCYSSAIFSQLDEKTKIDYRNYNYKQPNRQVPYLLPEDIEKKIFKIMKRLELKSGSVDLIYGIDNNLYFLEVNPIGQFGGLSETCNYNCERDIALNL